MVRKEANGKFKCLLPFLVRLKPSWTSYHGKATTMSLTTLWKNSKASNWVMVRNGNKKIKISRYWITMEFKIFILSNFVFLLKNKHYYHYYGNE